MLAILGIAVGSACASAPVRHSAAATWSVTVLGDSVDPRFTAVREATEYWNRQLADIGVPPRFGSLSVSLPGFFPLTDAEKQYLTRRWSRRR